MAEIRLLTTESRLMESETGVTPASESKAGAPRVLPPSRFDEMRVRRGEGAQAG